MGVPWWLFFQICSIKSFKTRPKSPYGGETSIYSLLQQGVYGFGGKRNTEAQPVVKRSADYIFLCKMKRDAEAAPTDASPPYYGHPEAQNVVKRSADYIFMCKI